MPVTTTTPTPALPGRPTPIVSPEIRADGTVTFRLRAIDAKLVKLSGEWGGKTPDMTRDEAGVWSVTVGPIAPAIYGYSFNVDGLPHLDPSNTWSKPARSVVTSVLEILSPEGSPTQWSPDVAHGEVRLHDYYSESLGKVRRLRVYTPPGYDVDVYARFPVLYLLHGSGDNEATWTEFGRAHVILDNLIATGKAVPMVVVMTDGHAASSRAPETGQLYPSDYEMDLLSDVMPLVEGRYRIRTEREHRAIAGLSMGGQQSLLAGLNHRDLFAWVGAMSSAIREPERTLASFWADPVSSVTPLKLLWISIGKDDFLLDQNHHFEELLVKAEVPHQYIETNGGHQWMVWRQYLAELALLLFVGE